MCSKQWSCPFMYASTLFAWIIIKIRIDYSIACIKKKLNKKIYEIYEDEVTSRMGRIWSTTSLVSPWCPMLRMVWCPTTTFQFAEEFLNAKSRSCSQNKSNVLDFGQWKALFEYDGSKDPMFVMRKMMRRTFKRLERYCFLGSTPLQSCW